MYPRHFIAAGFMALSFSLILLLEYCRAFAYVVLVGEAEMNNYWYTCQILISPFTMNTMFGLRVATPPTPLITI